MMTMLRFVLCLMLVSGFVAGCNPVSADKTPVEKTEFKVTAITKELEHPWALAFLDKDDFLVTERRGKIWRINDKGEKTEISGVPAVYHVGQGGLLDIALDPEFKNNGLVYFSYAAVDPADADLANTEVARARLDLKKNALSNVEVIFKAEPKVKGDNHFGSRLLFAPDGTLYVTLGERFNYEKQAQNLDTHLGKVIRIHTDGSVPKDNPFTDISYIKPRVFTYGHRNVQGIMYHPDRQEIWVNEHGPRGGDEVNVLKPGANYGWPIVTFGISYMGMKISDHTSASGMEDPIHQWTPSIAPSGMLYYTGDKFPGWKGSVFHGALAFKNVYRQVYDKNNKLVSEDKLWPDMFKRIRDIRQSPDGYIYLLTDEGSDDWLIKLEPVK